MTVYTIEVRANAEQYDVLGRQVAREILQLPASGNPQGPLHQPLSVQTAQLYQLTGNLSSSQLDQLTHDLLIDPVTQVALISLPPDQDENKGGGKTKESEDMDKQEENKGGGGRRTTTAANAK